MKFKKLLAFTLIELLVVIAIVGVLSAFVFVSLNQAINTANDAKRKADLSAIQKAILMYSVQNNQDLPSLDSDCDICDSCPEACENLYSNLVQYLPNVPLDPKTNSFYKYNALSEQNYTLRSILSNNDVYEYQSETNSWNTLSGIQPEPMFSPSSGPIAFNSSVTIASANADTIYYTTNGDTPTTSSAVYTTPIIINTPMTIKALAVRSGFTNSSIATASYTQAIQATPSFNPNPGAVMGGTEVTIVSENADTIYYTTNGDTPTTSSAVYTTPIIINTPMTIKALAVRNNYVNSEIGTGEYTLLTAQATPSFSPASGTVAYGTTVTIISEGADAIYYTTDGSTPTTSSTNQAITPLVINADVTVKALAVKAGYNNSVIGSASYTQAIQATPSFSPASGTVAYGTTVTIISEGADAIYYTTDGSTPTTSSTNQAITPLVINADVTVKALAVKAGYSNSEIGQTAFVLLVYTVTYDGNGGTCTPTSRTVNYGETSAAPSCSRTGYTLSGFTRTAGSGGTLNTSTGAVTNVTGDQTITANWTINQYVVTYDAAGGTCIPSSRTVNYGATAAGPTCAKKDYNLIGYTRTAGSGGTLNTSTGAVTNVSGNQTIRPTWQYKY